MSVYRIGRQGFFYLYAYTRPALSFHLVILFPHVDGDLVHLHSLLGLLNKMPSVPFAIRIFTAALLIICATVTLGISIHVENAVQLPCPSWAPLADHRRSAPSSASPRAPTPLTPLSELVSCSSRS